MVTMRPSFHAAPTRRIPRSDVVRSRPRQTYPDPRAHADRYAAVALAAGWVPLGLLVAVWPGGSVTALEWLVALGLVAGAGAQLFVAIATTRIATPLRVVLSVTGVLAVWPAILLVLGGNSVPLVSMWLGMSWAILGIGQALVAVWDARVTDPVRYEIAGVVTALAGLVILIWPMESFTALAIAAAAGFVVLGAANALVARADRLAAALLARRATRQRSTVAVRGGRRVGAA
ncbi:DUF308 domain-containing protein [Nocardia takedensis]